ncbi:C2H2-type zinc finger transcription factor [Mucor lusitanicus]|uniref:C2H2-type zinc finger transcription factor n=2 Tax=Mucor circinelloides f. lusitanicus TaxID=29924 RepID=A0A162U3I3_MUCCL|nr:C2H2-type zinc finger transcription factor [Mucor lusitanicus]OAD09102.1 C2H2-type zinc finger transcription factor [Mucor lusitanicus CBS 277.49]
MDNNPFRSHQPQTGNYMTPTMGGQQQQPQQQQQPPYQSSYGMGSSGYGTSTPTMGTASQSGYQQQQPSWQYQQPQTGMMSPTPPQQSSFASTLPQQNSFTSSLPSTAAGPPPSQFSPYTANASLMSSTATSNVSTPPQMNAFGAGGNTYQSPYSMPTPNTGIGNYPNNNNMMFNNPTGYQQPYQQQHDPSNFYIPPNFGMSTPTTTTNNNNTMFQPQQPRHAPVDASTLLKGTQVRRVECPVCQKMIEGDDMAVNHHVNEHYS